MEDFVIFSLKIASFQTTEPPALLGSEIRRNSMLMINNGRTRIWHINFWKFSSPAIYNAVCISLFNAACHLKMLFCHFILASLSLLLFFSFLFSVVKNFTVFPFKSRWTGKTHVFPIIWNQNQWPQRWKWYLVQQCGR